MYNGNNGFGSYNQEPAEEINYVAPRPTSLSVVCIVITLALVVNLISLLNITSEASVSIPLWYWALLLSQLVLLVASIIGLWQVQKWGAYAYTVNFLIVLSIMGVALFNKFEFNVVSLVLPVVLLFFIYRKFDELR